MQQKIKRLGIDFFQHDLHTLFPKILHNHGDSEMLQWRDYSSGPKVTF